MNDLPPIEYYPVLTQPVFPINSIEGNKKFYVLTEDGGWQRVLCAPFDICVED